jgi:hypothetical protein
VRAAWREFFHRPQGKSLQLRNRINILAFPGALARDGMGENTDEACVRSSVYHGVGNPVKSRRAKATRGLSLRLCLPCNLTVSGYQFDDPHHRLAVASWTRAGTQARNPCGARGQQAFGLRHGQSNRPVDEGPRRVDRGGRWGPRM